MKKIKKVLFGVIGLFALATLPLAFAQNVSGADSPSQKAHIEERVQEIYSQLNLTDDQKKQLEANKQQHRAKMESSRQAMKIAKKEIQEEIMKPLLDMAKITALHNQIKDVQSQMEDDRLSSILAVRSILTPDQFTKFVNLMHKHKQEHGD